MNHIYPRTLLKGRSHLYKPTGLLRSKCPSELVQVEFSKTWPQGGGISSFPSLVTGAPGFPGGSAGKESACNVGDLDSIPGFGKIPWRRERLPTPVFWPGEFLELCSAWTRRVRHD